MMLRMILWLATLAVSAIAAGAAGAAQCGNSAGGFDTWKAQFHQEAAAHGIRSAGLRALDGTSYATKTIWADRHQHSFHLSLEQFMAKRGAAAIVSRGKTYKRQNAALFSAIERRFGVPAGPLIAIWGMETGFGGYQGNSNILSAAATLAYDCRRSDFFTDQLYAALQLVDRGYLAPNAIGADHGEIGQTQFLPVNAVRYAVDGDGNGRVDLIHSQADALASTANYLRGHGWRPGSGYQPGQANFGALQSWNAASVYQKALAIIGKQIDGG